MLSHVTSYLRHIRLKCTLLQFVGVLDEATETLMSQPRCGCPDFYTNNGSRSKRFTPIAQTWLRRDLSWFLENDSRDINLNRRDVEIEIDRALQVRFR